MKQQIFYIVTFILVLINVTIGQSEKYLNWCLDSKHHKSEPGPESSLYGECTPWKKKACCTQNVTENLHKDQLSLYNFNYDHCAEKRTLSSACKKRFTQDHCFYECSPNVGPWVVQEVRSWRKERYYKVPLCASDCEAWFNDCREDYTCTDNWSKNFDWVRADCDEAESCMRNTCPSGSMCQTFLEIYRTAENFCQKVWDDAWQYTPDDRPCMRIWFNETSGNPNEKVARWKASTMSGSAGDLRMQTGLFEFFVLAWIAIAVHGSL